MLDHTRMRQSESSELWHGHQELLQRGIDLDEVSNLLTEFNQLLFRVGEIRRIGQFLIEINEDVPISLE